MVTCWKCSTAAKQMKALVGVMVGLCLSQTMGSNPEQVTVQLCGPQLADMLDLVCEGHGFHFKRAASPGQEEEEGQGEGRRSKRTRWSQDSEVTVVRECCLRRCTLHTLGTYCAATPGLNNDQQPGLQNGNERRISATFTTTLPFSTTTHSSAHYDPNTPSAQVIRGPPAGSPNSPFFYVQRGSRPTRSPLVNK
ncbi:uncharacterized protein LOC143283540 [Babylonia areolata]|uniref:uncharacterized protein LOC143283540 n=1 Tax=Babylonia areolata TaxID=304850 RepID=UPI003FD2842F